VYLLAVLLVSGYWGLWLGLLTGLASTAAFNFFHLAPEGEFDIATPEHWVALAVFFVTALVTSTLTNAVCAREAEAERRRREADLSAQMARVLLSGSTIEDSTRLAGQQIAAPFDLASVEVDLGTVECDRHSTAIPLVANGQRIGTVLGRRRHGCCDARSAAEPSDPRPGDAGRCGAAS
jgi:two-component system sensor histidine kinase KdpD